MTVHQHGTAQQPDREPVLLADALATALDGIVDAARSGRGLPGGRSGGMPDPRSGGETNCRRCGAAAEWHRAEGGRWILIEPGAFPTASVPAGRRWRIAGDGTAVNLGSAVPSDICRVSHFDICEAAADLRGPGRTTCASPSHQLLGAEPQCHQQEHGAFTEEEPAQARARIFGATDGEGSASAA